MAAHFFALSIGFYAQLLLLTVCVRADGNSTGIVEVDLVFPRNETYAPSDRIPVIFAIQNSSLASFVQPEIYVSVRDLNNGNEFGSSFRYSRMRWANFSSHDPYFEYQTFGDFDVEGHWALLWDVSYSGCSSGRLFHNTSTRKTIFTTKNDAQKVDLVTPADSSCDSQNGVAMEITKTMSVRAEQQWDGGETCAALAPTPTPNACQVKIDSSTAASIASSLELRRCKTTGTPSQCGETEDKKGGTGRIATTGRTAMVGTFISLLAMSLL